MAIDILNLSQRLKERSDIDVTNSKSYEGVIGILNKSKATLDEFYIAEAKNYGIDNPEEIIANGRNLGEHIRSRSLGYDISNMSKSQNGTDLTDEERGRTTEAFEVREKQVKERVTKALNAFSKTSVELLKQKAKSINENEKLIAEARAELAKNKRELAQKNKEVAELTQSQTEVKALKEQKENEMRSAKKEIERIDKELAGQVSEKDRKSLEKDKANFLEKNSILSNEIFDLDSKLTGITAKLRTRNDELTKIEDLQLNKVESELDEFDQKNKEQNAKFEKDVEAIEAEFAKYGIKLEDIQKDVTNNSPEAGSNPEAGKDSANNNNPKQEKNKKGGNNAPSNGGQNVGSSNDTENKLVTSGDRERSQSIINAYLKMSPEEREMALEDCSCYTSLSNALDELKKSQTPISNQDMKELKNALDNDRNSMNNIVGNESNEDIIRSTIAETLGEDINSKAVNHAFKTLYSKSGRGENYNLTTGNLSKKELKCIKDLTDAYASKVSRDGISPQQMADFNTYIGSPAMCAIVSQNLKGGNVFTNWFTAGRNQIQDSIKSSMVSSSKASIGEGNSTSKNSLADSLRESVREPGEINTQSRSNQRNDRAPTR